MWEKVKSNKAVLYGGVIIVLIGAFMILRNIGGGSSAGTQVVTSGPTDAQVAAQTQLALAQMQLQASTNSDNASYSLEALKVQAELQEATLSANLQQYAIDKDAANQQLQINAANAADERNANLTASVTKWTLETQANMQASNQAFQLDYAANANQSVQALAQIQAGVVNNQIQANTQTTIASLQAQAAQLASYLGAQVSMNESDNAKDVSTAQIQAGVQKHGQTTGLIGGIVGGILGIFSDRRLKADIVKVGEESDGLGVYSFRYWDTQSYMVGHMADEVRAVRPWLMGPRVAGYDTVNYQAA